MRQKNRIVLKALITALALLFVASFAAAADYPERDIKILCPYSPGGGFDTQARGIAPFWEKYLPGDVNMIVENMPGAGGLVMASHMSISKPTGYKIGQFPVAPLLLEQYLNPDEVEFKLAEFEWIGQYQRDIRAVAVRPDLPVNNWEELVEYSKKQPVLFGTPGMGSPPYKEAQLISKVAGLPIDLVNYPGSNDAQAGMARGEIEAINLNFNSLLRWGDDARIIFIWADERHPMIPDVPTALEAGVPQDIYDKVMAPPIMGTPRAFAAPPGTPPEVVEVLTEAFMKAMEDPEYKAWLEKANQIYGPVDAGEAFQDTIKKMNRGVQDNLELIKSLAE